MSKKEQRAGCLKKFKKLHHGHSSPASQKYLELYNPFPELCGIALAENFILQELYSYCFSNIVSWAGRTSEIEFVTEINGNIIPIEVRIPPQA